MSLLYALSAFAARSQAHFYKKTKEKMDLGERRKVCMQYTSKVCGFRAEKSIRAAVLG
jgi:hypothetical protein